VTLVTASSQSNIQRYRAESNYDWERPSLVSYLTWDMIENLKCLQGSGSLDVIDLDHYIPKDQPQVEED